MSHLKATNIDVEITVRCCFELRHYRNLGDIHLTETAIEDILKVVPNNLSFSFLFENKIYVHPKQKFD